MSENDPQMEAEANYFAMCLLMPQDLLVADWNSIGKTRGFEETVEFLASRYQVSEPMMTLRLSQLKLIG